MSRDYTKTGLLAMCVKAANDLMLDVPMQDVIWFLRRETEPYAEYYRGGETGAPGARWLDEAWGAPYAPTESSAEAVLREMENQITRLRAQDPGLFSGGKLERDVRVSALEQCLHTVRKGKRQ